MKVGNQGLMGMCGEACFGRSGVPQGVGDQVGRDLRDWDFFPTWAWRQTRLRGPPRTRARKPGTDVQVQPHPVHVVVEGLAEALAQKIVIGAGGILEGELVARERRWLLEDADPVLLR